MLGGIVFLAILETVQAQYTGWQHFGSLYLLTTPEGANLPATASVLSGHSANKAIVLTWDTVGQGEISGHIFNPHDRAGKSTTSVTKSGSGTWTLSGTNSYTGPTRVAGGVLACAASDVLGSGLLDISSGAKLQLNYAGTRKIAALTLNGGAAQAAGTYGSTASPAAHQDDSCFAGPGTVTVTP